MEEETTEVAVIVPLTVISEVKLALGLDLSIEWLKKSSKFLSLRLIKLMVLKVVLDVKFFFPVMVTLGSCNDTESLNTSSTLKLFTAPFRSRWLTFTSLWKFIFSAKRKCCY